MRTALLTLLAAVSFQLNAQALPYGEYPWTAIEIGPYVHNGGAYTGYNVGYPYALLYGMPSSYEMPDGTLQGNDKMHWTLFTPVVTGWHEIRVDNEMWANLPFPGAQLVLYDADLTFDEIACCFAQFPGMYATGGLNVPGSGQSESIFIQLEAGHTIYIVVDGFAISIGKFELRVQKSFDSQGNLVSNGWWDGPPTYQHVVD